MLVWLCLHSHTSIQLIVELCGWGECACCGEGLFLRLGGWEQRLLGWLLVWCVGGVSVGLEKGFLLGDGSLG